MPIGFRFAEISFAGAGPALSLSYEVLYRVGDGLYRGYKQEKEDAEMTMTYMSAMPKEGPSHSGQETFVIDWTEEREEFFRRMRDGLVTLISRIAHLLAGDAAANVDQLVAAGYAGLLPAPQQTEGD